MDALDIPKAVVAGFDWGARCCRRRRGAMAGAVSRAGGGQRVHRRRTWRPTARRCHRRPSTAGGTSTTSPPSAARRATGQNTHDFNKLIWKNASPQVGLRRCHLRPQRRGLRQPRPRRHRDPQLPVAPRPCSRGAAVRRPRATTRRRPAITVPTITVSSDFDGPAKDGASYRQLFTGRYSHQRAGRHRTQRAAGGAAAVRRCGDRGCGLELSRCHAAQGLSVRLECRAQLTTGAMQPRHHGTQGNSLEVGDLPIGQLADVGVVDDRLQ